MNKRGYFSTKELAILWNISHMTLAKWRTANKGPEYITVGGRIRYPIKAVKEYEKARAGLKAHKSFNNPKSIGEKGK